jgi:hypothetical protein
MFNAAIPTQKDSIVRWVMNMRQRPSLDRLAFEVKCGGNLKLFGFVHLKNGVPGSL